MRGSLRLLERDRVGRDSARRLGQRRAGCRGLRRCRRKGHRWLGRPDGDRRVDRNGGKAGAGGNGGSAGTGGHTSTGGSSGTGGATATGGAAGTGGTDAGPHVERQCSGATVGKWEDISPPGVNHDPSKTYGFEAFAIDSLDTATLYAGTDHLGLYKTTDCGSSWQHVNTGRNGAALDSGAQWTMAIDRRDPRGVVYTISGYSAMGVFKTTNGGVDWDQIRPPTSPRSSSTADSCTVRMDPTDRSTSR